MDNALSTAQIAQYRDRGYVFPVPALTPVEAAGYRQTIEDFERHSGLVAGHVIRNKGHLKLTRLYDLIFHPKVLDAVQSVLGPDILSWGSSLFVKDRRLRRPPLRRHAIERSNKRGGLNLFSAEPIFLGAPES